jgi:hypothetical protein
VAVGAAVGWWRQPGWSCNFLPRRIAAAMRWRYSSNFSSRRHPERSEGSREVRTRFRPSRGPSVRAGLTVSARLGMTVNATSCRPARSRAFSCRSSATQLLCEDATKRRLQNAAPTTFETGNLGPLFLGLPIGIPRLLTRKPTECRLMRAKCSRYPLIQILSAMIEYRHAAAHGSDDLF